MLLGFGKVRIDDIVIRLLAASGSGSSRLGSGTFGSGLTLSLCIKLFGQLMGSLSQFFGCLLDGSHIFAFNQLAQGGYFPFDIALERSIKLVTEILDGFFSAVDQTVCLVTGFNQFLFLLVFGSIGFGFLDQLINIFLGQTGRSGDLDGPQNSAR